MNLEDIMLSERSQTQKTTYCMIPLTGSVQNRKLHRDRMQIGGCQGLKDRMEELFWGVIKIFWN